MHAGLYNWRDGVAREEDESTGYVLSRANLVKLAQALPTTIAQGGSVLGRLLVAMHVARWLRWVEGF